jgi:hypothetical protein
LTQILFSCGDPYSQLIYNIENNSADTLYVEKPCCDDSNEPIVRINNVNYLKISPHSGILYFIDNKVGWPGEKELNNTNFNSRLKLIKAKDTLDFVFAIKDKCEINIDGQIATYTRKIE